MGWATAGGHGRLANKFGQGADNILEAVVTTWLGHVIANQYQYLDLFWAIR